MNLTLATLPASLLDVIIDGNNVLTAATLVSTVSKISVPLAGTDAGTGQFSLSGTGAAMALADWLTLANIPTLTGEDAGSIESSLDSLSVQVTMSGAYNGSSLTWFQLQVTLTADPTVSITCGEATFTQVVATVWAANGPCTASGLSLNGQVTSATTPTAFTAFPGYLGLNPDSTWTLVASEGLPSDVTTILNWLPCGDLANTWSDTLSIMTFGLTQTTLPTRLEWTISEEDAGPGFLGVVCAGTDSNVLVTATISLGSGIIDVSLPGSAKTPAPPPPTSTSITLGTVQGSVDPGTDLSSLNFDQPPDGLALSELVFCLVPNRISVLSITLSGELSMFSGALALTALGYTVVKPQNVQDIQRFFFASLSIGPVSTTLTCASKGVAPVTWSLGVSANFTGCQWTVGGLITAFDSSFPSLAAIYFASFSLSITPGVASAPSTFKLGFGFANTQSPQYNQVCNAIFWHGPTSATDPTPAYALNLGPLSFSLDIGGMLNLGSGLPIVELSQLSLLYASASLAKVPSGFPPNSNGLPKGFAIMGPQISFTESAPTATLATAGLRPSLSAKRASLPSRMVGDEESGGDANTEQTVPVEAKNQFLQLDTINLSFTGSDVALTLSGAISFYSTKLLFIGFTISQPLADASPTFSITGFGVAMGNPEKPPAIVGAVQLSPDEEVQLEGIMTVIGECAMTIGFVGGQAPSGAFGFGFLMMSGLKVGAPTTMTAYVMALGVNMTMALPSIATMNSFPLISMLSNPSETLNELDGLYDIFDSIFQPLVSQTPGENCIAIGMELTTSEVVSYTVILDVSFGNSLTIDLFGQAQMLFPPKAKLEDAITLIQVGIQGTIVPSEGLLQIIAQIQPGSYLFSLANKNPSGRSYLGGGGAIEMWFSGDYAGAFVISLGGYSAVWTPPSEYPTVPRLTITWQPSSGLSCVGEAYFTLCSKGIMGGMAVQATWAGTASGAVTITYNLAFDFAFDALILWSPFTFALDISIQISIAATIKVGIITFGVHLTLGAGLALAGTPFYGTFTAYIQSWSLNLPFGDPPTSPTSLTWAEFESQLMAGGSGGASAIRGLGDTSTSQPLTIQISDGIIPTQTQQPNGTTPPAVDPCTLVFSVTSFVPLLTATALGSPLSFSPFTPPASYTVIPMVGGTADYTLTTSTLTLSLTGTSTPVTADFVCTPVETNAPTALWTSDVSSDTTTPAINQVVISVSLKELPSPSAAAALSDVLKAKIDPVSAQWPGTSLPSLDAYDGDVPATELAQIASADTSSVRLNVAEAFTRLGVPLPGLNINLSTSTSASLRSLPLLRQIGAGSSTSSPS